MTRSTARIVALVVALALLAAACGGSSRDRGRSTLAMADDGPGFVDGPGDAVPGGWARLRAGGPADAEPTATVDGRPTAAVADGDDVLVLVPPTSAGPTAAVVVERGDSTTEVEVDLGAADPLAVPAEQVVGTFLDDLERLLADVDRACRTTPTCRAGLASTTASPSSGQASSQPLVFAVDTSGSMSTDDLGPPRWTVAREAFEALLDEVGDLAGSDLVGDVEPVVGLLTWSTELRDQVGPSDDLAAVRRGAAAIDAEGFGTDIGRAIDGAIEMVGDAGTVVLLSDGDDQGSEAAAAADRAAAAGIVVHTVGLGARGSEDFDAELLLDIADTTGGIFHHATSPEELREAFRAVLLDALAGALIAGQLAAVLEDAAADGAARPDDAVTRGETDGLLETIAELRAALNDGTAEGVDDLAHVLVASGIGAMTTAIADADPAGGGVSDDVPCEGASDKIRDTVLGAVADTVANRATRAVAVAIGIAGGGAWSALGGAISAGYAAWQYTQRIGEAYDLAAACLAEVQAQIAAG